MCRHVIFDIRKNKIKKKKGMDFTMRKSIKAVSALACAVAVAAASLIPATTAKAELPTVMETLTDEARTSYTAIDPMSLADGEVYYTIGGGFTKVQWGPLAIDNMLTKTDYAGVYSGTFTVPAYKDADGSRTNNEFKLCTVDNMIFGDGWDHSLIAGTTYYQDNMSRFRIPVDKETEVTVYWDTTTGAVVIKDADGNSIDYMISFVGYDNELKWMTVADMSKSSWGDYAADKAAKAQAAGCTSIPDLASLNAALEAKLSSAPAPTPETTAAASTATTAAASTATTAANTATTAKNASTKTGDAAPVAMVVTLCAAAAVVAVAAKKKEA